MSAVGTEKERNEAEEKLQDLMDVIRIGGHAARKLTDWNVEFIESVSDQYDIKGFISPKQAVVIDELWEKI